MLLYQLLCGMEWVSILLTCTIVLLKLTCFDADSSVKHHLVEFGVTIQQDHLSHA